MQQLLRAVAFAYIIGGSFYFGFMSRPIEMDLAIVAGAIALAFSYIDKIQKFKGAGFEAEMRQTLESMVAKETEPPKPAPSSAFQLEAFGTDADTKAVLRALGSEKYTWRYVGGVAEDTGLPREKIQKALDWFLSNGLATETRGVQGPVWGLSPKGRALLAAIQATAKAAGA